MKFFEKYLSPGACKCLPPRGGVGDQNRGGFLVGSGGDRTHQFVDHRNFIMTGTSVYQNVMALHIALCLMSLFVSKAYNATLTLDDVISMTLMPHVHLLIVACFGLYEVNTVHAVDVRVQDVVSARYLALICSILCSMTSEVCYILKDNLLGQVGWFSAGILLHRCYEVTLPTIQVADPEPPSSGDFGTQKAFKVMFLKMVSLFGVFLFYVFIVGMAVASQKSYSHALYSFGYVAFVLLIFELSLARFIYKALFCQQDLAVLAAILLLVSGHIFSYSRHISPKEEENQDFNTFARFLEYCAQLIIVTSVMKFKDQIYFKRIDNK